MPHCFNVSSSIVSTDSCTAGDNHAYIYVSLNSGVYKQWTGLLELWNSGMVDWIVFVLIFIVCHIISTLLCFHLTS